MTNDEGNKNGLLGSIAAIAIIFLYYAIVSYVLFAVLNVYICRNFLCGMIFELFSFAMMICIVLANIVGKALKTGYYIPLVIITFIYTLCVHALNIFGIFIIPSIFFVLINMVLLFIYALVGIPMLIVGKQ